MEYSLLLAFTYINFSVAKNEDRLLNHFCLIVKMKILSYLACLLWHVLQNIDSKIDALKFTTSVILRTVERLHPEKKIFVNSMNL